MSAPDSPDDRRDEAITPDEPTPTPELREPSVDGTLAPQDPEIDGEHDDADQPPKRGLTPLMIASSVLALVALGVAIGVAAVPAQPTQPTATIGAAVVTPVVDASLPMPSEAIPPETVIARIGDREITQADFAETYVPGEDPSETISQMIEVELVVQAARAEGVAIDNGRIDAQIDEIRRTQTAGTDAAFDAFLRQNNIASVGQLREILERQQLIEGAMMNHTLANQAHARHILLAIGSETDSASRKPEADDLLAQIEAGGDFAALAEEFSEDPGSKFNGGDLGWTPRGLFVEAFEEAIFSMQPGEVRVVESQFGWHIIELLEGPEVRPLSDPVMVQQWMRSPMGQEAFNQTFIPWIEELRIAAEANGQIELLVDAQTLISEPSS